MKTLSTLLVVLTASAGLGIARFPSFPSADLVLGQSDFTTATLPPTPSASSENSPDAVAVDPLSGKVFVADTGNNRVLRYATLSALQNGASAEVVIGQATFLGSLPNQGATAGANTLSDPAGICVDRSGRLWIADRGNNRILAIPNAATVDSNVTATRVFGQSDFTSTGANTSSTTLNSPSGVWVDASNTLWIADSGNNRILRFDNAPGAGNGPTSNGVLGQDDFNTNNAAVGQDDMSGPTGVVVDTAGNLWVADAGNNRVLKFAGAAGKNDGDNADVVLGQSNFNSSGSGTAAVAMNDPVSVAVDTSGELWVTDRGNNRLMGFANSASIGIGGSASSVIGQMDFFTGTGGLSANKLSAPQQIWFDATGSLWVADGDNNRTLRFTPDNAAPVVTLKTPARIKTTHARIRVRGRAFDTNGVAEVAVKAGSRPYRPLRGTTHWSFRRKLQDGRNRFLIKATDTLGNTSRPVRVIAIKES